MQVGVPPKPMQGFPSPWQSCGRSELIGTRAKNGVNTVMCLCFWEQVRLWLLRQTWMHPRTQKKLVTKLQEVFQQWITIDCSTQVLRAYICNQLQDWSCYNSSSKKGIRTPNNNNNNGHGHMGECGISENTSKLSVSGIGSCQTELLNQLAMKLHGVSHGVTGTVQLQTFVAKNFHDFLNSVPK